MAIEIERKFLVEELPATELQNALLEEIQQDCLIQESDREARIRRKGDSYFLTEKKGAGPSREEHEIVINGAIFDNLWPMTDGKQLEKARNPFKLDGHLLELDVYHGSMKPLMVLEVEFSTEEQAIAWFPPWFAGSEVTTDKRFKNAQLAMIGKPDHG